MKAKTEAKNIARELYMAGFSHRDIIKHPRILEINESKPVSKSSVSAWTKDLTRPENVEERFQNRYSERKKAGNKRTDYSLFFRASHLCRLL